LTVQVKTAIVTGAAQGIGEATALRLVSEGVRQFLLIDRQADKLSAAAAALEAQGARVRTLTLDLNDVSRVMSEVRASIAALGAIDILVNAAGTTARGGITDTSPELFDHIFSINVRAPFFLMQIAAPAMRRGGVIVNICSMLAYGGPPFLLAYSASKAALAALTRGTANALKRDGIHVFGINLGWTWTPAAQEVQTRVPRLPENSAETLCAKQPFGRLLRP